MISKDGSHIGVAIDAPHAGLLVERHRVVLSHLGEEGIWIQELQARGSVRIV